MTAFTEEEYDKLTKMVKVVGSGEFDSLAETEDDLRLWFDFVQPMVSRKQFGNLYYQAIVLLACHKLKMAGYGDNTLGDLGKLSNAYAASSVSDGGSSISFASSGAGNLQADAEYAMTIYGSQFLQLRRMCIVPIHVSGEENVYARV